MQVKDVPPPALSPEELEPFPCVTQITRGLDRSGSTVRQDTDQHVTICFAILSATPSHCSSRPFPARLERQFICHLSEFAKTLETSTT